MPTVGQDLQVNAIGQVYGQMTVTTFFYKLEVESGVLESATADGIAEEWANALGSSMIDPVSHDWKLRRVEVRDPRTDPGWASGEYTAEFTGVVAQDSCPPTVAMVVTRRSDQAGRRYRGRVFIPAVPVTYHVEGELTGAAMVALQAFADDMATPILLTATAPGLKIVPSIWSKVNQASVPIVSCLARPILRSQRRREIGVGK